MMIFLNILFYLWLFGVYAMTLGVVIRPDRVKEDYPDLSPTAVGFVNAIKIALWPILMALNIGSLLNPAHGEKDARGVMERLEFLEQVHVGEDSGVYSNMKDKTDPPESEKVEDKTEA